MKSIERKFRKFEEKKPLWSSYITFAHSVRYQHYSRDRLIRYFNKLVDQDDYDMSEKKALIINLIKLTNEAEAYEKHGIESKNPLFIAPQKST